jgi:putative hydroxymethylpyrimidine transport system permease protein
VPLSEPLPATELRFAKPLLRTVIVTALLLGLWQAVVTVFSVPPYILPPPGRVLVTVWAQGPLLLAHGRTTLVEMLLGLALGSLLGAATATGMAAAPLLRRMLLPVLVVGQALPVFAIAPLLVLWLDYGLASKVAMAVLIIFFPVASSFLDGLRRTDPSLLDLARVHGATRWQALALVRLPAALPALGSGLRIAATVAPIGAIVGEWVGSAAGLGFLMLHANARMQTDLLFAALLLLALSALALRFAVEIVTRRLTPWADEGS